MRSKLSNTLRWTAPWLLLILCLTLGGGIATTTSAQSPVVPSVEAGKPFKVAFDHDGQNVTHYRLLLSGKQISEVPSSARVGGVVTIDVPALAAGSYSFIAVARNAPADPLIDPTETSSAPYPFEAKARTSAPAPAPPMWRQITILLADGRRLIESITPITAEELPETLRLLADGRAVVVSSPSR